jgi:hypothetical protein
LAATHAQIFKIADLEKYVGTLARSALGIDFFAEIIICSSAMTWFTFSVTRCGAYRGALGFVHEYFSIASGMTLLTDDYAFTGILLKLLKTNIRDADNFLFGRALPKCHASSRSIFDGQKNCVSAQSKNLTQLWQRHDY